MFSCKKANLLISKQFDKELSIVEKMNLTGHLMMCKVCRHVNIKYHSLRIFLKKLSDFIENGKLLDVQLSPSIKVKIKTKIKEMTENNKTN